MDAVWFSPFYTSPDHDFGYDVADYCDIDPRFGTLSDFDRLIEEAHKREIKVMLDLVVNHTSHLHPWFKESRSSRDNPKRDWYVWKNGRGSGNKLPNNWRNNFFGPAWTWDEKTGQYYLHSFLKEQPDLNWRNQEVREAVGEGIRFWLNRGVDGFRLDVAHLYCKDKYFRSNPPFFAREKISNAPRLSDRTIMANIMKLLSLPELQVKKYNQHQPETHEVLKQFRQIFDAYPAITSVGEIIGEDPAVVASYYGKNNDELHMNFYLEIINCRWKAAAFRRCIDRWESALPGNAWPAYALSNHDVVRAASRYDRNGRGKSRTRLLSLMLLTLRGTPFIYYGEEIGMKEAKLPREKLRDPVGVKWYPFHRGRDGCRTPMQWDGSSLVGFSHSEPWLPIGPDADRQNVAVQEPDYHSQLNFVKKMIWMRKSLPALLEGDYQSITEGVPEDCFCYYRRVKGQRLAIFLNFSLQGREIDLQKVNNAASLLISTNPERRPGGILFPILLESEEGCLVELD